MLNNRRVLVVVPARGGSKGIALKNLRQVAGRSLVSHAGHCVAQLHWVDRAVVSTDHLAIRDEALAAGLEAPFLRPYELSGDRVGDIEVLSHALSATEADDGSRYDIIVMLQPTSPSRRPEHVTAVIQQLIDQQLDSVWTVSPTDLKFHPLKQLRLNDDGQLQLYDARGASIIARQQLDPLYHRNGIAYALTRDCLTEQQSLLGARSGAVVMHEAVANIDTEDDLAKAEQLLSRAGG